MRHTVDIKELAIQAVREKCKKSFYYFMRTFWSTIISETPVWNWHIEFLCGELQQMSYNLVSRLPKEYDLLINIPPATTKSTITTVMFPAWLWTQDPSLRIISNSYSGDLSTEHASLSRDIITSEKYKMLFPEVRLRKDKSGKGAYANTKHGQRNTTSTGGTITGKHAHVIINDDPLTPKQADSEAYRYEANRHIGTLASRTTDKEVAVTITIMQRLHEEDVAGTLLKKGTETLKHICLPAEIANNVKPEHLKEKYKDGLLDPVRLNRGVLAEQKNTLGSMTYAGQYGQDPVVEGGNIIKKEWFGKISAEDFANLYKRTYPTIHFFVDTAYTDKKENDPTGIIGAVKIQNNIYITSAKKVRMEFPELTSFLPMWVKQNKYSPKSTIRIEPKANGLSVIQQLRKYTALNVTNTPSPVDSKLVRTQANTGVMECGTVILVEGNWNDDYLEELSGFPTKAHDEYVDLTNYAIDYFITDYTGVEDNVILNSFR